MMWLVWCFNINCNMWAELFILLSVFRAMLGSLVVRTKNGEVKGESQTSDLGARVDVWASIPYATPPLGPLRFKHPRPIKSWTGVKDVTSKANSCIQIEGVSLPGFKGEEVWLYNTPVSEDCLFLQVAVPGGVPHPTAKKMPVMVWIYGGSYHGGTYTLDLYDPRILASEHGVVVVSIQYRVASLGFLYLATEDVPGNAGMYDQVMALQWIKENIHSFGGDPDSITLFSESAGSASVAYHLLSPVSRPLFTRAILQSASALNPWGLLKLEEAKKRSLHLAELMGCPYKDNDLKTTIDCMRGANATRMVNREWDGLTSGIMEFPFTPIVDGTFLPDGPKRLLSKGQFKKTQILLGANKDEGIYFIMYYLMDIFKFNATRINVSRSVFDSSVIELNKYVKPVGLSAIKFTYTNWMDPDDWLNNVKALDRMVGDYHFTCPVVDFAQYYSDHRDNSVYMYYFNHFTSISPWPHWSGVMHGDEIAYIFGDPFRKDKNYTKEEKKLSRDMMTYWTNFAKTGSPSQFTNGSWSDIYWPVHSPNLKEYLELRGSEPHQKGNGFKAKECAFWRTYLPELLQNVNSPPGVSLCKPGSPCCPPSSPSPSCPCTTSSTAPASTSLAALTTGLLVSLASVLLLALVL